MLPKSLNQTLGRFADHVIHLLHFLDGENFRLLTFGDYFRGQPSKLVSSDTLDNFIMSAGRFGFARINRVPLL